MLRNKATCVATTLVTVFAFTATTASSASARSIINYWPRETVYALGPGGAYVTEWMGLSEGWTNIGGPAEDLYAGSAGLFATDPTSGDIWEYNGTPGSWTDIGGPGWTFAQGNGHLYGLGPGGKYVAEWNGTPGSWTIIGGPASYIYAGGDGLIATSPDDSENSYVFHYNGTPGSWTQIGGDGLTLGPVLAVGTNAVYRVSSDGDTVSQWTSGTTWTSLGAPSGQPVTIDTAGDEGLIIDDGTNGLTLKYNGTPGSWSQFGPIDIDSPGAIVESLTNVYGFAYVDTTLTNAQVYVYSPSDNSWTLIGGPVSRVIVAED